MTELATDDGNGMTWSGAREISRSSSSVQELKVQVCLQDQETSDDSSLGTCGANVDSDAELELELLALAGV